MAKLIHENSMISAKSELDFFSIPPTQVSVKDGFWSIHYLDKGATSVGPYKFELPKDDYYYDFSKNFIQLKLKITKSDGTPIDDTANVGPINLLGKTFFQRVILKVEGKEVVNSGSLYAYQAYLETLLNYGWEAKNGQLQLGLFYKDTDFENLANNTGYVKRKQRFNGSAVVELFAPVHSHLFNTGRYMIRNCKVELELYRNPDKFLLMSGDAAADYKIIVEDVAWHVWKVELQESANLAIDEAMTKNTVKYPIRRVSLINNEITSRGQTVFISNLYNGDIPRRIILGLVRSTAFSGTYETNPFEFLHYKLNTIELRVGGKEITPLKVDFVNNNYGMAYVHLLTGIGLETGDRGVWIDYDDFGNGNTFFVFDLTPDGVDSDAMELIKSGTINVKLTFAENLNEPAGIELISYAEFDGVTEIDVNRQVHNDY